MSHNDTKEKLLVVHHTHLAGEVPHAENGAGIRKVAGAPFCIQS
jgi:hypothetical protein